MVSDSPPEPLPMAPAANPLVLVDLPKALCDFSLLFLSLPGASGSSPTSCEYHAGLGETGLQDEPPTSA